MDVKYLTEPKIIVHIYNQNTPLVYLADRKHIINLAHDRNMMGEEIWYEGITIEEEYERAEEFISFDLRAFYVFSLNEEASDFIDSENPNDMNYIKARNRVQEIMEAVLEGRM